MKQGLTELVLVLDRSGSMQSTKADAEGGLRKFLAEQRLVPGELEVTIYRFDDYVEMVTTAAPLGMITDKDTAIEPRGYTALLDAMGQAIDEVGERLKGRPEAERPSQVIFVTVTDGGENHSKRYTRQQVFEKVERQTKTYRWSFVFIGANQDAIAAGASLGVPMQASLGYAATPQGTQAMYAGLGRAVKVARVTSQPVAFSDLDRERSSS